MRFLLGGYTADADAAATGIGLLLAGATEDPLAGGPLSFAGDVATTSGSPSWIAWHPSLGVVYAALEMSGRVQAFRRTGQATFTPWGAAIDAGDLVCHVAVAPDGSSLIASCWGDGRIVRMTLDEAGRPSAPTLGAAAVDPYGPDSGADDRDDGSFDDVTAGGVMLGGGARDSVVHAGGGRGRRASDPSADMDLAAAARAFREAASSEYAHLVPDHDAPSAFDLRAFGLSAFDASPFGADASADATARDEASGDRVSRAHQAVFLPGGTVATTDMGWDLVRFWRLRGSGLAARQDVVLPRGSGPRHMVFHPSGYLYVVTELSHEVFVLAADAGGTWQIVAGTPLGAGVLADDAAAELSSSRDGTFLYAGLRGTNTIATLRVRGDGSALSPVALAEAGVDWPRHHLVVRDTLLIAGQRSGEVASLALDERTGVPGRVRHRAAAPSPTCILPLG